jgi:hypothetical protein
MWNLQLAGGTTDKNIAPENDNNGEISFFDVKDLYEKAYAFKVNNSADASEFSLLMARARQMDEAYRAQLTQKQVIRYEQKAA